MKYWALALLCVLMVAVETTIIPYISIRGIGPDIVGSFVALVSMLGGIPDGLFVAAIAGFLEDMSSAYYVGLFTFVRLAIGYLAGMSHQRVFQDWFVVPVFLVFITGFIGGCLQVFLLSSFGVPFGSYQAAVSAVLCQAVYSALLAPLLMRLTCRLDAYVQRISERRRSL